MTGDGDPLVVHAPGDREIVLSRLFDAPASLVFAAFTRPELLVRWYGARGWRLVECEVDLRVGGRWRFVSQGPGGERMGQSGCTGGSTRPGDWSSPNSSTTSPIRARP